jgi:hypothetical protein
MSYLCPPALIYLVFSTTQIIIDIFKGLYNTAFFKFIVMFMVTILLNALCQESLGIISWIIVFIPFIFMTIIVSMLLYIFGLNATTGTFTYTNQIQPDVSLIQNQPKTNNATTYTPIPLLSPSVKIFNPNMPSNFYSSANLYSNTNNINKTTTQMKGLIFPLNDSSSSEYKS